MSTDAAASNNNCYSFAENGNCRFGDRCRFSHGAGHPGVPRQPREPRQPRAPREDREPRAPRDNSCHAFTQNGSCKFGENCRFTHGDAPTAAGSSGANSSSRPRGARRPAASKSQLCFSFSESQSCQYGDNCRFAHGADDSRDLQQLKRRAAGVCYNWKDSGDCKYGDNCRFAHEHVAEKEPKESQ